MTEGVDADRTDHDPADDVSLGREAHAARYSTCQTIDIRTPDLLLRSGYADQRPLGVSELSNHEGSASALRAHPAPPAEALSLLERGLDVGKPHVEEDTPCIAPATHHTTVAPAASRVRVHEPVVARLGDRL